MHVYRWNITIERDNNSKIVNTESMEHTMLTVDLEDINEYLKNATLGANEWHSANLKSSIDSEYT